MRTTVVVVTWRGAAHVGDCLDALAAQHRPHRTLVVDNASTDGTAALLAGRGAEVLRLATNTGYAGGLAAALPRVDTPFVAWLNDDAAPEPGWLAACEDALDGAPGVGAVAARLVRADGTVQSAGVGLDADGYGGDLTAGEPFGFCGGAAVLRTDALRAAGGVPAEFFCYYEDTDTAWRLRLAGWDIAVAADVTVRHAHGASSAIGSAAFHRWNERNRLAMLVRCAPATVALGQLVKFGLLLLRPDTPTTPNYAPRLRLRVLGELARWAPRLLRERRAVPRAADRATVWRRWKGSRAVKPA